MSQSTRHAMKPVTQHLLQNVNFDLANLLKDEMRVLGVSDIHLTEHCFLYGKLPATKGYENAPALGVLLLI